MAYNRLIQLIAMLGAVVLLTTTALLMPSINKHRKDAGVTQSVDQTLPPSVSLVTAALGSFRGLIVDALWYRANELKQDGKFHEANQASKLIAQLQPRFPQVWSFHAWNMAYNISVATHTPDERWYWVNSGINLLRDHGIPLNPTAPLLYKELGWIFSHKVAQISDDMHWYYKRKLAEEWHELLGAPTEGATTEQAIEAMRPIAEAPDTLQQLLAQDPRITLLWEYLSGLGYEPNVDLLRQIGGILMYNYNDSPDRSLWIQLGMRIPNQYDPRLDKIFTDATLGPAREPLLAFLRKYVLVNTYHMDPAVMVEVMEQYGPLDWRHPAAHGVYWNHLGVKVAGERSSISKTNVINIYRARVHSIQFLAHWGKVSFDPQRPGPPDMLPDPRFVEKYEAAFAEATKYLGEQDEASGTLGSFETGHENLLLKFLVDAYMVGDMDEAQRIYTKVRQLYGHKPHNLGRYRQPIRELVLQEYLQIIGQMVNARAFVQHMLFRAVHEGLGGNHKEWFDHGISLAHLLYREYESGKRPNPLGSHDRQKLPPFDQLFASTYIQYMTSPRWSIIRRARVWTNTPIEIRLRLYDRIYNKIAPHARAMSFDPDRVLPQPPGMAVYRKSQLNQNPTLELQTTGTETIERK